MSNLIKTQETGQPRQPEPWKTMTWQEKLAILRENKKIKADREARKRSRKRTKAEKAEFVRKLLS